MEITTQKPAYKFQFFIEALRSCDINSIRGAAFRGIPEESGLRPTFWKILLGLIPPDKKQWNKHFEQSHELYALWKKELMIQQEDLHDTSDDNDHPLSSSPSSKWSEHFHNSELLVEIEKDVRRTFPHLHFFNRGESEKENEHYTALKQILFVYAKLNPGIGYVQGMNEILAPLYYIIANENGIVQEQAEAHCFFCFTNLMGELRDNFCKTLDNSDEGICAKMKKLNGLLKRKDPELWKHLESVDLNPQFYSFRWLTLLLSQEFELPDVLRLWDSFFADPNRFQFFLYFCCAMLMFIRDKLLNSTFAESLKLLQKYPTDVDVLSLLKLAKQIRISDDHDQSFATALGFRETPDPTTSQTNSSNSSPAQSPLQSRPLHNSAPNHPVCSIDQNSNSRTQLRASGGNHNNTHNDSNGNIETDDTNSNNDSTKTNEAGNDNDNNTNGITSRYYNYTAYLPNLSLFSNLSLRQPKNINPEQQ